MNYGLPNKPADIFIACNSSNTTTTGVPYWSDNGAANQEIIYFIYPGADYLGYTPRLFEVIASRGGGVGTCFCVLEDTVATLLSRIPPTPATFAPAVTAGIFSTTVFASVPTTNILVRILATSTVGQLRIHGFRISF
jgi:hypothetical protein